MFDNNDLPNNSAQFAISHETLALLRWLIEYHAEELKSIIEKALQKGLHEALPDDAQFAMHNIQENHESIIDFFNLLELLLLEASDEFAIKKARENNLQPTIDQIDSTICDTITVQSSIERAATKLKDHPESSARELLFKELLKRWTPHKQQLLN